MCPPQVPQAINDIIHPPAEDPREFLEQHTHRDLEQLTKTLGRSADETAGVVHLVLRSLLPEQRHPPGQGESWGGGCLGGGHTCRGCGSRETRGASSRTPRGEGGDTGSGAPAGGRPASVRSAVGTKRWSVRFPGSEPRGLHKERERGGRGQF